MFAPEAQRDRKNQEDKDPRTGAIIAAAIAVHRHLGPGLLESAYKESLCRELDLGGHRLPPVQRSVADQGHPSLRSLEFFLFAVFSGSL
jgi:hypothetical protein